MLTVRVVGMIGLPLATGDVAPSIGANFDFSNFCGKYPIRLTMISFNQIELFNSMRYSRYAKWIHDSSFTHKMVFGYDISMDGIQLRSDRMRPIQTTMLCAAKFDQFLRIYRSSCVNSF